MDRREALKKLGAGGAIAATGSFVLSSRSVAYAASGGNTGLIDVPDPSAPLPINVQTDLSSNGKKGTVAIADNTSPSCSSGAQDLIRGYCWRINSYNVSGGNGWKLQIMDSGDSQPITNFISTTFTQPNSNHGSILLRKANNGGAPKPLDRGDEYSIDMYVTWQCQGASGSAEAIYRFASTFPAPPTGQPLT